MQQLDLENSRKWCQKWINEFRKLLLFQLDDVNNCILELYIHLTH